MERNQSHRQRCFQLNGPLHYQRPYSVPVSGATALPGETRPYRNAKVLNDLPVNPEDGVNTIIDLIRRAARKFGDKSAFGTRKEIRTHLREGPEDANGNKKQLTIPELSPYHFTTYSEYERLVTSIGYGLVEAGLRPHDKICMWAQTSSEWLTTFHGAASQSITIVTAYSNLGLSGLQHALDSTGSVAIYVDSSSISRLAITLEAVPKLRLVVYKPDTRISGEFIQKLKKDFPNVRLMGFEEIITRGKASSSKDDGTPTNTPSSEDICAIMYTSGSTGNPKGVPIKHKNMVAAVAGFDVVYGEVFGHDDIYLGHLPLAHIMEFIFEHAFLFWGVCIGYGSPRTLFDSSVENCKGDLRELGPTMMVGVPAIWEASRKSIVASINGSSSELQTLFWDALRDKKKAFEEGTVFPTERDEAAFSKVRSLFGGRLRFTMSGGSGIAKNTQEFLSFVVAPLTNGSGMTETTGSGAMMDPSQWQIGALGGILGCIEIKLIDYPEANYLTSRTPTEGEICIRGPSVTDRYWEDEEQTKTAFMGGGWLKTGDIGRIDENGALWIIDRKKNLVKNINGQYIALEKLESIYRSAPVVTNVCMYADSSRVKPIAIILANKAVLNNLVQSTTGSADAQRLALEQLQQKAREYDLPSLEVIEAVVIPSLEEWDVTNGMTTAVGKLKRRAILEYHKASIDEIHQKSDK